MRINTNISSMTAQESNVLVNKNLTASLEKLSSGLRINKASDDASGMAIADKLRTQASSIGQGIANANSGASLIQIADKAMAEQSNILDIVKTKLIQASTSTTSVEGREAIRKDITKLLDQLDNIANQTNYNGINLLNEKGKDYSFQIGEYASSKISMSTAYAATTSGLGSSEEIPVDADATLVYGDAGSIQIKENGTELVVNNVNTASSVKKAISIGGEIDSTVTGSDSSFKVSATNVKSLTLVNSAAGSVTITTDDSSNIAILNSMVSSSTNLTKIADGTYTLSATAGGTNATLNFSGEIDITNMVFTGLAQGSVAATNEAIVVETNSDVSVTKLSGGIPLGVDAATVTTGAAANTVVLTSTMAGKGSTNPSGLVYGGTAVTDGIKINTGTATVKVDQTLSEVTDASVAINGLVDDTSTKDASFSINAKNVERITMTMSLGGPASVVLTTNDTETMAKLTQLSSYNTNLTDLGNGTFQFSATAANANAVLDFGIEKLNVSNLKFSGVQNGTAAGLTETIFIQTNESVSVTKNGISDDQDVSLQGASGTTIASTKLLGELTDSASLTGSLAGLKELGEDLLTAELANQYMSNIDSAINQINTIRSDFGSTQNQLESAIRNMMTTQTNIKAAESVIRDVDYAAESANFNKQNIIAQAGTYAMSQANQVQQNVLKLLQ